MKHLLFASLLFVSLNAHADRLLLIGTINVTETSTAVTTDKQGRTDIDVYSSEDTYVIGWNEAVGQQAVTRVAGCGLLSRNDVILRVSDRPNEYKSFFSQTTYKLTTQSNAECKATQRKLRSGTYVRPVSLQLNHANKTFSVLN